MANNSSNHRPLYATDGGGYATFNRLIGKYVWHSDIPSFLPDACVGDPIPDEWGVVGTNAAAHAEAEDMMASHHDDVYTFDGHLGFCY